MSMEVMKESSGMPGRQLQTRRQKAIEVFRFSMILITGIASIGLLFLYVVAATPILGQGCVIYLVIFVGILAKIANKHIPEEVAEDVAATVHLRQAA